MGKNPIKYELNNRDKGQREQAGGAAAAAAEPGGTGTFEVLVRVPVVTVCLLLVLRRKEAD